MAHKITQRTLAQLEGTGKRRFIRDTNLTGFGIEVSAKGKATYFVETRVTGTRRNVRSHIGNVDLVPLDDARQQARHLLAQAAKGNDPRFTPEAAEQLPDSLGTAVKHYIAANRHRLAPSTLNDYRKTFSNCFGDWEHLPVRQLSRNMVKTRYLLLLDQKSVSYVNKAFRNIRTVLNFHGVSPNPIAVLRDQRVTVQNPTRDRFLSGLEIYHVLEHYRTFRPRGSEVVVFCLLTGARINEALSLRWENIRAGKAYFETTKNKKRHFVPLVRMLPEVLGPTGPPEDSVFDHTYSSYRTAFENFRDKLNFKENWTSHDLRRTFSEHMNLIGYSESDIAIANNQSSTTVTTRHYLGGQLAKKSLLRKMYWDLQKQYFYYMEEAGGEIQKVPDDWLPVELRIQDAQEWTPENLAAYTSDYSAPDDTF